MCILSLKDILSGHMNVHKGLKPFICEICGERFRQRGHQIRHNRIHTGMLLLIIFISIFEIYEYMYMIK